MVDSVYKGTNGKKLVAVVVPLSRRSEFLPDEEISLKHLEHFLGRYDRYFVVPQSLQIDNRGLKMQRFSDRYFGTPAASSKLLLSRQFYERFSEYQYLLIYHLDSLVFSDQLSSWCAEGFDYIGAPWITYDGAPYASFNVYDNKVGNGGFSLRKIQSFLKVFQSDNFAEAPAHYWRRVRGSHNGCGRLVRLPWMILKHLKRFNNARWEMSRYPYNEDAFWTNRATHYYPEFKVAPVETALRFAFECGPRICLERNGGRLPFGCHAWKRYDREFWEPYVLQ
jgi:hypothetical protein